MSGPFPSAWQAGLDGSKEDRRAERLAKCLTCYKPMPNGGWWRIDRGGDEGAEFFCTEKCYQETQPAEECPSCKLAYRNGDTCPAFRGGCPMGGDF